MVKFTQKAGRVYLYGSCLNQDLTHLPDIKAYFIEFFNPLKPVCLLGLSPFGFLKNWTLLFVLILTKCKY